MVKVISIADKKPQLKTCTPWSQLDIAIDSSTADVT